MVMVLSLIGTGDGLRKATVVHSEWKLDGLPLTTIDSCYRTATHGVCPRLPESTLYDRRVY
jgi:hypothetical protein